MTEFQHLHVHSHYSLLDGLAQLKPLVQAFKKRGFKAATLTDYGSMYGAIEFYEICQAEEIKPIIGFEAYVAPRTRFDVDPILDKELYHLVLIAENYDGYRNLMKISSAGHLEGAMGGKPRIDRGVLAKYSKNVFCLSGCARGEVPSLIKSGRMDDAKKVALAYKEIFGPEHYYLELQDHPMIEGQVDINVKLIQLGKELDIPLVVTRDVHYLDQTDAEAGDILTCIRDGVKVGMGNREDYRQVDRSLNTGADIASRFRHVPEAIANTVKIADRIDLKIELNKWHFAPVDLPPGKTVDEALREEVFARADMYYPGVPQNIRERLDYELGIITKKGYCPYFLCVSDYVRYAKAHGIVETTRGSAAGSVVSYVLGITTVDPIRFKLPFERFLNPFRPSPPDIDTDFADDRRDDMISYVTEKYGKDKVAQIVTFGTMAARASVRDVGRALGLSYSFCDQVSKLIPMGSQGFAMTLERALKEEPDLKKLYDSNADVKRLLDLAKKVEGCARHTSIHAAGVVISPTDLTEFTPVQYEVGGSRLTTQYEMHAVEAAGVLKMDFLGIRNLSILGKSVEIVEKTTGDKIDIYALPLDDKLTFEKLARGETMGVFQLGGSGMTRWLKELRPNNINDIMAMVALYRPGPMESIPEYIRRKHHPETVHFLDPRMASYLDASFGLLVYQDDVLLTAIELAGYDWMEADKFRKAMGKKIPEEMERQKAKFYEGCAKKSGLKKEIIDELWKQIEPFAAYGFNKAHAASYGIVAYQTAYMKAHYPVQYMTAVLQAESGDEEKVAQIVHECEHMGIDVLPPDINESFRNFAMVSKSGEKGRIRFGLMAVKNVGEHICEVIYAERKQNGPYKSLEEFLTRVTDKDLNKKSIEALAQCGALDGFGIDRGIILRNSENILYFGKQAKDKIGSSQNSLFSEMGLSLDSKIVFKEASAATIEEKMKWEKNLLGVYVSAHPFGEYEKVLREILTPSNELDSAPRSGWVIMGGVVDKLTKKITKKGSVMMFVTIQDLSGSTEFLVFPKTYEQTKDLWVEGQVMVIVGKTPAEDGDNKVFVEKALVVTPENINGIYNQLRMSVPKRDRVEVSSLPLEKKVYLSLSAEELKRETSVLKKIFTEHVGNYRVYFCIGTNVVETKTSISPDEVLQTKINTLFGVNRLRIEGGAEEN